MNGRYKRWMLAGLLFFICGAVLLAVMNVAEVHSHTGEMSRQLGAFDGGHSRAEMFRHGHQVYRENVQAEMGGYGHDEEGTGIIAVAAQIGLLLLGLFLWRTSGRSEFRKWTGIVLAAAGVATLLPIVIAVPVLALMAYFIYKLTRNSRESAAHAPYFYDVKTYPDFLDEWEQKAGRTDNQSEKNELNHKGE